MHLLAQADNTFIDNTVEDGAVLDPTTSESTFGINCRYLKWKVIF
jgi:hypothetical protein